MAVSRKKKEEILLTLENEIKTATSVAFTSNTKLTVEEITNIRNDLRKVDAKFMLAKKTLIRLAFKNVLNVDINEDIMPGQVAVLISHWDKIAWFSVVNKHAQTFRKDEKIKFVGAYMDWSLYDANGALKLATIPSREVLLAKLLGSMKAPISALARFFDWAKTELESKWKKLVGELIVTNTDSNENIEEISKQEESTVSSVATNEDASVEEKKEEVNTSAEVIENNNDDNSSETTSDELDNTNDSSDSE